jgi:hypothetical protein
MTDSGIIESAYYESLHETPLKHHRKKKLFEMNRVISDTAEYGCYLFDHEAFVSRIWKNGLLTSLIRLMVWIIKN